MRRVVRNLSLREIRFGTNSKAIAVFTTDPGCNWGFYEASGFRRVASFDDEVGSYCGGRKTKGLIMMLYLDR